MRDRPGPTKSYMQLCRLDPVYRGRPATLIDMCIYMDTINHVLCPAVDFGPGYRLYFTRRGSILIVMLAGSDKSSQARDIKRAQRILIQLELEP